jgi:hypothetical protein
MNSMLISCMYSSSLWAVTDSLNKKAEDDDAMLVPPIVINKLDLFLQNHLTNPTLDTKTQLNIFELLLDEPKSQEA